MKKLLYLLLMLSLLTLAGCTPHSWSSLPASGAQLSNADAVPCVPLQSTIGAEIPIVPEVQLSFPSFERIELPGSPFHVVLVSGEQMFLGSQERDHQYFIKKPEHILAIKLWGETATVSSITFLLSGAHSTSPQKSLTITLFDEVSEVNKDRHPWVFKPANQKSCSYRPALTGEHSTLKTLKAPLSSSALERQESQEGYKAERYEGLRSEGISESGQLVGYLVSRCVAGREKDFLIEMRSEDEKEALEIVQSFWSSLEVLLSNPPA